MVKPWIVADFLRRLGSRQPTAAQLADATRAIVDSDDAAQRLYLAGGQDAVIDRLVRICGLTHTSIRLPGWWSYTDLTAADAIRFGRCLADGRAAGPTWTPMMQTSRWPPRIIANESAWWKYDAPANSVTGCLPAFVRSGSVSSPVAIDRPGSAPRAVRRTAATGFPPRC
jgi:hypothetical protein